MSLYDPNHDSTHSLPHVTPPPRFRHRLTRRQLLSVVFLCLLLLSGVIGGWTASLFHGQAAGNQGGLTFQQFLAQGRSNVNTQTKLGRLKHTPPVPQSSGPSTDYAHLPPSAEPSTMKPISQALDTTFLAGAAGVKSFDLVGSDQRLEIQIQPGSLDLSHAVVTNGATSVTLSGGLKLQVTQLQGHFSGSINMLGTYLLQVIDGTGKAATGVALRTPLTFIYHYQSSEMQALNLDPNTLTLSWPDLLASARKAKQSIAGLVIPLKNDPVAHTLTAQSSLLGASPFTLSGPPQNQNPPKPHLASVQGNAGQVFYGYPLQVVPGPAGFTPQLSLDYSSSDLNGRNNQTSPANSAGDGWSLSLGSISADVYPDGSADARTWYFLSGIANVSDRLIPNPTPGDVNNPDFLTEHISQLRIRESIPTSPALPCFKVWDTSGTYYEFGCTPDSVQSNYNTATGVWTPYRWDLDKIVAPNQGLNTNYKIIKVTYTRDCYDMAAPSVCGTTRDAAISQISYGYSSSGISTIDSVVGTIDFSYLAPPYAVSTCKAGTFPVSNNALRCDDPGDGYLGIAAPQVMSTLTLQSVTSYVGTDTTGTKAYGYNFSYQDTPPTEITEFISQENEYIAGEHLLTQITPVVYQSGTAHQLKPVLFTYTARSNTYSDTTQSFLIGGNWQIYSQQTNWQYLSAYIDTNTGIGETIAYQTAYGNTHGTPDHQGDSSLSFDDRHDPFYCDNQPSDCVGSYAYPDDRAWTQQVVTLLQSLGADSSSLVAGVTSYSYSLAITGHGNATCSPLPNDDDCVGDNWTPLNTTTRGTDGDWQDYYHAEYRGFNVVYTTKTSGATTVDSYYSTKGWATGNSDASNYNVGHVYQEDVYSGSYLQYAKQYRTTENQYTGDCHFGPTGCTPYPNSCNGNYNVTYAPCEVMVLWSQTWTVEGGAKSAVPTARTDYTYDDYSINTGLITTGGVYHNLLKADTTPTDAHEVIKTWFYSPVDTTVGNWVYYDVNKATHSETDDTFGNRAQCQYTTYDEGAPHGMSAGWPTTVKTYKGSDCGNPASGGPIAGAIPLTTTYTGYDAYGNVVATVDGVGASNSSLYSSAGCSASPTIISSHWTAGHYTSCTTYDSYNAQPLSSSNVATGTVNLSSSVAYDSTQGRIPISVTDANNQTTTTTYSYDGSGNNTISTKQPGEIGTYSSQSSTNSHCSSAIPTVTAMPCFEIDNKLSLYPNAVSQTFYDGQGRAVETSSPVPPPTGANTSNAYLRIVLTEYNDQTRSTWQSEPFVVVSTNKVGGSWEANWIDPNGAQDYLGNTVRGTATYLDPLGRTVAVDDPAFGSTSEPGISCPSFGTATMCTVYGYGSASGDSQVYAIVTNIDANNHVAVSYADALGRIIHTEQDSGVNSGTLTANEQTTTQYDVLDNPLSVTTTDLASPTGSNQSVTVSVSYDNLGRMLTVNDPDKGNHTYTYDADGHVLTDVSGTRTIGYNYDLSGRVGCQQSGTPVLNALGACTAGTQPLVQNTYDTSSLTVSGTTDYPLGRLTKSIATTVYNDASKATATSLIEYDQRGRSIGQQEQIVVPAGWGLTQQPPTYQMTTGYNDANQPVTSLTNVPGQPGQSTTQVYDSVTGVVNGLSNNSNTVIANLATLTYNNNALLGAMNFLSTTGTTIASEQFGYDSNLRTSSAAACWQTLGCGGTNGKIFSQSIAYDPASNVISTSITLSPVNGVSGSGGSETQNFCYDEQNRLVWAGNSGTIPTVGNGTCGSASLQRSLNNASYSNSYVYTHLGQLYRAPYNGGTFQQQYLYCNSTHPHQLTGFYPMGTTCANVSNGTANPNYVSYYDAWGNVNSRTFGGIPAYLYYDALDHFTEWNANSNGHEWYVYDASGNRVMRRSTNGSGATTLTTYAFGEEEHTYNSTGATNTGNTYYYSLAGRLIGKISGTTSMTFQFYLPDLLGSVVATFSNAVGTTTVLGNSVYQPYGHQNYQSGSMGTAKGFTGQYNDSVSGLDYYKSRYYDPVAGVFLSADSMQGNMQGMNPYEYVRGNPETSVDPTGHRPVAEEPDPGQIDPALQSVLNVLNSITMAIYILTGFTPPHLPPFDTSSPTQISSPSGQKPPASVQGPSKEIPVAPNSDDSTDKEPASPAKPIGSKYPKQGKEPKGKKPDTKGLGVPLRGRGGGYRGTFEFPNYIPIGPALDPSWWSETAQNIEDGWQNIGEGWNAFSSDVEAVYTNVSEGVSNFVQEASPFVENLLAPFI